VGYIRLPSIPLLHDVPGALASNALMAMGASRWHDLGYLGQGIRVGVIDLGYLGYQDLMGSELPSSIETGSFVDGQEGLSVDRGTRHGTAVAEIIHDVAPESDLFLARIATTVDLVEAVEWLLSREVDVICTSLGWFDVSPGDGTGLLADQVNRVRAEGVLWVTSAGDQRQRHWCGDWENPLSGDYYRFTPYSLMNWLLEEGHYELSPGTRIDAYLRWSDWAAVEEDYDLYLWEYDIEDPVPRAVATSTDAQTGLAGQTPTEALTYVTHEAGKLYALSILAHDVSRGVHLELFLDGEPRLETRVASQSLASPADVEASLGVAAVSAAFPYGLLADSSMGPAKGPGGVGAPGIEQPRIAGYGDIETASMSPLGGSSAAAPHAAGAAALILSRYPGWGPDEIESLLIERGEPYPGQTGWDPGIGFGRLYIGDEPAPQPERAYLPMTTR